MMDEQAYFWSERWQQGEREAEADIQAGRLHRFENLDDAFAFLDEVDLRLPIPVHPPTHQPTNPPTHFYTL